MTLIPTLRNAELSFRAGHIDVPLEPLVGKRKRTEGRDLKAPSFAAPELGKSFAMEPVREVALRELIRQADSGRVRVTLPLPKQKFSVGPVSLDLTAGHAAVIELEVDTARVLRKKTKGTIQPAVRMPLGLKFQGLYLNEHGEVIADIENFPDINLTRLSDQVPQIPSTLDQMLDLLFPEKKPAKPSGGEPKKGESLDLSGMTIEARSVQPRCIEPLDLGQTGRVMLGKTTQLDVEYSQTALVIRGRAHIEKAQLAGRGFVFEGVTASGDGEWRLVGRDGAKEMQLLFESGTVRAEKAKISFGDDGELSFGNAELSGVKIVFRTGADPELTLIADHLAGELEGGRIGFKVGGQPAVAELAPARARGRIAFEKGQVAFTLDVEGAQVTVPQLTADLGLVRLDVTQLVARGSGQLAGSSEEVTFSGELEAAADVASSHLMLGDLGATLAPGSRGTIRVTEVAVDRSGLSGLIASAALELRLHSGSIPIGPRSVVRFSAGAQGTVELGRVALSTGQRWPYIDGRFRVEAGSDPVAIEELLELPPGKAKVQARLTLEPSGHLMLSNLEMNLQA
jgi:hypothetical protein